MTVALATLRTALADSWANRRSFVLQLTFMVINDLTWVIFWALFFLRVRTASGWSLDDVIVMFSLLTVSAGIALGVFANCRRVGRLAADGALDEMLVLPSPPLLQLLCRRVEPSNIGDVVFGVLLFAIAGHPTPARIAGFAGAVLAGVVIIVGFLVLCGAVTMLAAGSGDEGDLGFHALILFASYPLEFFGGAIKVLLFTVVPAAFVTGVPVSLFRHFDLATAVGLAAAAATVGALGWLTFTAGLRRYSSGSLWQR